MSAGGFAAKKSFTKWPAQSRAKKEEVKTYKDLGLNRSLKSKAQRSRLEKSGVHKVIGGQEAERPYLKASKQRYHEIRREVTREFLEKARASGMTVPLNVLMQHLHGRIEQITYDRLATEQQQSVRVESSFLQHHGRSPTVNEKARFVESSASKESSALPPGWGNRRHALIDHLLNTMQDKLTHNPARYQTIWAEIVGAEVAQQSCLERVNGAEGTAYFKCFNSALSYQLQRQAELPKKLSRALGVTVRTLRVTR